MDAIHTILAAVGMLAATFMVCWVITTVFVLFIGLVASRERREHFHRPRRRPF